MFVTLQLFNNQVYKPHTHNILIHKHIIIHCVWEKNVTYYDTNAKYQPILTEFVDIWKLITLLSVFTNEILQFFHRHI